VPSASKRGLKISKKFVKESTMLSDIDNNGHVTCEHSSLKENVNEVAKTGTEKLLEQIYNISNKAKQKGASAQKIDTTLAAFKKRIKTAKEHGDAHSSASTFERRVVRKNVDTAAYNDITSIASNITACASYIMPLLKKVDKYLEQINTSDKQFMTIGENVEQSKHAKREVVSVDLRNQEAYGMLFGCYICEARFTSLKGLKRHEHVHMGKYKCSVCKKLFARKYGLQRHKKNIHCL
jgi:hypothetical protein